MTKKPAKKRTKIRAKGTTKPSPQRVTKTTRAKGKAKGRAKPAGRDSLDIFIDAAAHALDLPVEPAWKPAIKANLQVTLRLAALFAEFPLPDDAEPAPVFVV